jgi:NAD(P)-dependent dehydrogenase (short-subunit alcohol dehydrogenase family)
LVRWTEGLAAETLPFSVGVFAMEPGFVRTAMTETAAEHGWGPVKQGLAQLPRYSDQSFEISGV